MYVFLQLEYVAFFHPTVAAAEDVKFLFSGCGANLRALDGGTEGASREQLFEPGPRRDPTEGPREIHGEFAVQNGERTGITGKFTGKFTEKWAVYGTFEGIWMVLFLWICLWRMVKHRCRPEKMGM